MKFYVSDKGHKYNTTQFRQRAEENKEWDSQVVETRIIYIEKREIAKSNYVNWSNINPNLQTNTNTGLVRSTL